VINLTITAHDGHLYELIGRHSQPQSSAAQLYRNDPYLTQRLIARLPIELNTWLQILNRLGLRPADLESRQPGGIHQIIANAIIRGDLNLYKLPLLDSANSLRGKADMGLCIIKGPKPHCATHLNAVPISSPAAAQALLTELGVEPGALLAYLNAQNLYNSYDQQKPLDEVLNRLASGELLAYKIPLPPKTVPKKTLELVEAVGPRYEPVPLAPEGGQASSALAFVEPAIDQKQPVNSQLEERAQELKQIGEEIRKNGFTPPSDDEVMNAVSSGDVGNRRFLVSIQKAKTDSQPVGFRRPDTGRTTMWTTTYDMIKKGDTSAPLLMSLLGSTYEPGAEYTMYILDQGENYELDGALTFVPTWENMRAYCPDELHIDAPEDPIYGKTLLTSVMNPETQITYKQIMEEFWSDAKGTDRSEYRESDINKFLVKKGFSPEQRAEFRARHLYRTQIGANAYFLGTGATEFTLHESNIAAIASDNIKINGTAGKIGVPEMLTIQRNPSSISQLEQKGLIKIIQL
jgi:hypothetical protein